MQFKICIAKKIAFIPFLLTGLLVSVTTFASWLTPTPLPTGDAAFCSQIDTSVLSQNNCTDIAADEVYGVTPRSCAISATCPGPAGGSYAGVNCRIRFWNGIAVPDTTRTHPRQHPILIQPILQLLPISPTAFQLTCTPNQNAIAAEMQRQNNVILLRNYNNNEQNAEQNEQTALEKVDNKICVENSMSDSLHDYLKVGKNGGGLSEGFSNNDNTRCWSSDPTEQLSLTIYACTTKYDGASCDGLTRVYSTLVNGFYVGGTVKITGTYIDSYNMDTVTVHCTGQIESDENFGPLICLP